MKLIFGVELSLELSSLANFDVLSKSDPQVFVYMGERGTTGTATRWRLVGATEMIRDNLNPKFSKSVPVDYYFEEVQQIRFVVCDIDKPSGRMEDQDLIGEVTCTLSDIVASRGAMSRKLMNPKYTQNLGTLHVRAHEVKDLKTTARLTLSGSRLDKKDFFGKSDPYLVISRQNKDQSWTVVHRTEVIKKTLDPAWRPFETPLSRLNDGDVDRLILVQCYDWDKVGEHDFIGECRITTKQLASGARFDLINPKKQSSKKYVNSGTLIVNNVEMLKEYSFLDYLAGGTEVSLIVSVDFTASNGDPKFSNSLHYNNPYEPNEYARAIMAVGEILAPYDSDNNFPVFGFGAKIPPTFAVNHCFPLTFNPANPEVFGVQGILNSYHTALQSITLYGPTNFAPTIQAASARAQQLFQQKDDVQAYLILLIITDGEITDMDDTVREIVNASYLPLSVIIVGVGSADFNNMEALDGDDGLLRYGGRAAQRDIVQFVPFRNFKGRPIHELAAHTLAEVPGQFLAFMRANNIKPRPPPTPAEIAAIQARRDQTAAQLQALNAPQPVLQPAVSSAQLVAPPGQ